jgi:hypothetical protein
VDKLFKVFIKLVGFFKKIFETFISFAKIIYERGFFAKKISLDPSKDYLLLANGPSLSKDYEELKDIFKEKEVFVVNAFCSSPIFKEIKPQHYLLLDGQYFFDKIPYESMQITQDVLIDIEWKINVYIPYRYRKSKFVKIVSKNKNVNFVFFNSTLIKGGFDSINHLLFEKNLGMLQAQNVLIAVLFNLIKNGAKNVFLFGAQNDWHKLAVVGKDNLVYLTNTHFYEKDYTKVSYSNIYDKIPVKMHQLLINSSKALKGYHNLNKYAVYKKVKIYNCSSNSFIDAFDRLDYEEFRKIVN